jgi:hypothetical protein
MGSALHVPLPLTRKGETISVKIAYKTTEEAPAVLWLEKEYVDRRPNLERPLTVIDSTCRLTEGKEFPYLFSQCQPIYARSLAPLQGNWFRHFRSDLHSPSRFPDTPSVKLASTMMFVFVRARVHISS